MQEPAPHGKLGWLWASIGGSLASTSELCHMSPDKGWRGGGGGGGLALATCTVPLNPAPCTMRFGSTAKVLLKCKLKYYRISECHAPCPPSPPWGS